MIMNVDPQFVLSLPMGENDADAETVRSYLIALLEALWEERDEFSGKTPLGNSDWDYQLLEALVRADLIAGTVDEDGYLHGVDDTAGAQLIAEAIAALRDTPMAITVSVPDMSPEEIEQLRAQIDLMIAERVAHPLQIVRVESEPVCVCGCQPGLLCTCGPAGTCSCGWDCAVCDAATNTGEQSQPEQDADGQTCRPVTVTGEDGEPETMMVYAAEPMSDQGQQAFKEIIRAARRKHREDLRREREEREAQVQAVAALLALEEEAELPGLDHQAVLQRLRECFAGPIAALAERDAEAVHDTEPDPDPVRYFEDGTCRICGVNAGGNHKFMCGNGGPEPRALSDGDGPIKRTPEYWASKYHVEIHDPDGWRGPDAPAWDEPITLMDFYHRAAASTTNAIQVDWPRILRDAKASE